MTALTEELFEALRARILRDEFRPGDRLPPERDLATEYGTNRNTLREAIRRLEQARLVTVRQGQGVTVADFRVEGTLDIIASFLAHGQDMSEKAQVVLDLLPARDQVLRALVRSAAERRTGEDLSALRALAEESAQAERARDAKTFAEAQYRWLNALINATHNLPFRWIANPYLHAMREIMETRLELVLFEPSFADMARASVDALEARDADRAESITAEFHTAVDTILRGVLGPVAQMPRVAAS